MLIQNGYNGWKNTIHTVIGYSTISVPKKPPLISNIHGNSDTVAKRKVSSWCKIFCIKISLIRE
jgi:hypothetical protein